MRRILLIVIAVVAILIVLGVGYFFATRDGGIADEGGAPYESVGALPPDAAGGRGALPGLPPQAPNVPSGGTTAKQRFGVVAKVPVADYFVDEKNMVFIVQTDGKVLSVSGGAQTILSAQEISGDLLRASFSADGKKVLATFGKRDAPQTSVFDVPTKQWVPLSLEVKEPAWSPTGTKIAFLSASGPEFGVLATMDLAQVKPSAQPVSRIYAQDVTLAWPTADGVVFSERSSAYTKSSAWRVDVKSKSVTTLVDALLGASTIWSPDISLGVLFVGNRAYRGGTLSLMDGAGEIKEQLDIITLPEKCVFTQTDVPIAATTTATTTPKGAKPAPPMTERVHGLFCAVPKDTTEFNLAPEPDGYRQRKFYTDDYFYKIDAKTGTITDISAPSEYVLDGTNLRVFGKNLFFVNRYDNFLYSLALD
jgi:hypothetical protein